MTHSEDNERTSRETSLSRRLSRHLRRLRWRLELRIKRRSRLRESERWHHEHTDSQDNAATALPQGERVDWLGFWLTELYAPSHALDLAAGLEEFGYGGGGLFHRENLSDWIRSARSWTGGSLNIGFFAQPGRFLGHEQRVDLPREFVFMQAGLRQVAPGITVLVAQFGLDEEHRGALDEVMADRYSTKAIPLKRHGGHSIEGPEHQKEARLGEVRDRYRSLGRAWLKARVPGLFSSQDGLVPPAWDLVLTQKEQLFVEEHSNDRWRDTLGFGLVIDRWTSARLPGLHLLEGRLLHQRSKAVPTFTGMEAEALRMLEGEHRGEDVHALMQYLHDHLSDLLVLWTLQIALGAHERQFAAIRDELAAAPGWHETGHRLKRLRRDVMPLAFDLQTLEEASQNSEALEMPIRYSDVDFTAVEIVLGGKPLRRSTDTLMRWLRSVIPERGESVARQGREITNALRVQGELLLATTNVRLQWLVIVLTLLVGAAGIYASVTGS